MFVQFWWASRQWSFCTSEKEDCFYRSGKQCSLGCICKSDDWVGCFCTSLECYCKSSRYLAGLRSPTRLPKCSYRFCKMNFSAGLSKQTCFYKSASRDGSTSQTHVPPPVVLRVLWNGLYNLNHFDALCLGMFFHSLCSESDSLCLFVCPFHECMIGCFRCLMIWNSILQK